MDDWLYYPEDCAMTFECEFIDGPRNNEDLCSLGGVSYFDSGYGDWYFDSTDKEEWPPGEYVFIITGILGNKSDEFELIFNLVDPCSEAEFTILASPFSGEVYELGDPEIVQPWTDSDLYSVTVPYGDSDACGLILVDFFDYDADDYF